jgi:hypothetical protein
MSDACELIPNASVVTTEGQTVSIWAYRQKSHLVVVIDPLATTTQFSEWQMAVKRDAEKWKWLKVEFLFTKQVPAELVEGVYLIDRYSQHLKTLPLSEWSFEAIEQEFLYYESCNC